MSSDTDRKRPLESNSGSSTPILKRKKKPLQELSESGPLTQEDVVYFQKEAIWRQMILYKQQVNQLRRDLKSLQFESNKSNKVVSVLSGWYDQIISLFNEVEAEAGNDVGLLIAFSEDDVDNDLKTKREKLSKILNHKLSIADSEGKISQLSQELAKTTSTNQQLSLENKKLNDKLDQLKEKVLKLTNEITRSQSKTLKRVYDIARAEESVSRDTTPEVKEETPNGKQEDQKEAEIVNQEETDKLMNELEELKSANQILTEQVAQLTQSNQEITAKSLELEHKLHNLTESDLDSNIHYKKIVKNNQALQEQIGKLSKLNSVNIAKLNELEKNQVNIKSIVEQEIVDENENLRNQLHKSEQDLVRIRTIRDELLSKNTILTSQLEDQKTNDELMSLNKALSSRIESLINDKQQEIAGSPEDKSHELTKEELISKVHQLNNEIKEIEYAFKSTREITLKKLENSIDQENLVKKLTIEKNKADQKYFASMRLKDSIQQENKLLKVQINKSQELIKNLNELEKQYLSKIEILTKSLTDYKMIKENSIQENQKLQDSIRSLTTSKESLEQEVLRNKQSLDSKSKELSESQSTINKQSLEINKLEKSLKLTDNLLQKYKTNNTNSILQEDEQQLEALRSIAKCSVCSKNWKDTAITVCGHVFCNNCTQERLAARLRRCPSCNKGFSANDLLSIHL
ncbi:BRE1 [[Candida] subhashii]|uniref:E3 ubiquitin protein ligase n=1 Tax=[Candida] subhashii TaxID=561895 RepID=A0A8J5UN20_9ASCO|nr:BRE1 [[Candida] subhashii]KAG7663526.1 BRE1 [[Candida] subhashii]